MQLSTMKKIYWLSIPILVWMQFGCSKQAEPNASPGQSEEIIPIHVEKVTQKSLALPVYASGVVVSDQEAKPAFKTGGIIKRVFVEAGDVVLKGQLLATLNLTEINAQVRQAEEGLEKARRDLQRVRNLFADSIVTLEQMQNATTALRLAEETVEIARFNQSYSEVRAPIEGTVLRVLLQSGEVVAPGMPVFVILGNTNRNWTIKAGLSDRDWARLRIGNPAEITFDAFPGIVYPGHVKHLAEIANPQSGTFDVEIALDRFPPRLAGGLVASVTLFPPSGSPATTISIDALIEAQDGRGVVYVVRDSSYVQRVEVEVGDLYEHNAVITKGLKPGTLVATTGGAYLAHGKKIKIIQ